MTTVQQTWKNCDAVCFDVDSTLCTTEMIDEFAAFCGVGNEVAARTKQAMGEGVSFRETLDARLKIMKPSRDQLAEFRHKNVPVLTEGVRELVQKLVLMGKEIYLVSGGFQSIIKPIAATLGLKPTNVYANKILFDFEGNYAGFDKSQPTSASGGKKIVIEKLKADYGHKSVVMIGDGMTDLEAYPTAELFIGFGGNVQRENVRKQAPWYVTSFKELIDSLSE